MASPSHKHLYGVIEQLQKKTHAGNKALLLFTEERPMFNTNKKLILAGMSLIFSLSSTSVVAEKYQIDPLHSFIQFSILHLGYSVLKGQFNKLNGSFEYDEDNPGSSSIAVEVDTASVDSNHAERDKHLRSKDFLEIGRFPKASFKSTSFKMEGDSGLLKGDLTLHGVTRQITMNVEQIGAGDDPWGGFRRGFKGSTTLLRSDYGIDYNLGPKSTSLELHVFIEGIRQ